MPLPFIPTLKGKGLHYDVEQAIYTLQASIGQLQDNAQQLPQLQAQQAQLQALQARLAKLQQQIDIDQAARIQQTGTGGGDTGGGGGGGTPGGGGPPSVPLPNLGPDVAAYAAAHPADLAGSCMKYGAGSPDYMVGLVAYLQGIDERVNFNGKRGVTTDPSQDALSYYYGVLPAVEGSHDVYVIDVIACYCGPEESATCVPGPAWQNVSRFAPGAWISTPPSN